MDGISIIYGVAFLLLALGSFLQLRCFPNQGWKWLSIVFIILFLAIGIYNLYLGFTRRSVCFRS